MTSTTNPLLIGQGLPPYGQFTPEAIGAGMPELLQQLAAALARHEAKLTTLEDPSWEQVMDPLRHIEERLRWAWGVVNHLTGVCDSEALRQVYCQQQPAVVRFYNRLGQSEPLYNALRRLQQRCREGPLPPLDEIQQRILTAEVQAMELQGVGLEPEQRQAFSAASTRLAELSTSYSNHVLDATKAWSLLLKEPWQVDGLPESLRELMAAAARGAGHSEATTAAGPWQLGLDLPRYGPFLRHSRQRRLREQAYRAYVGRASSGDTDNHPLIREILTLRHQQAQRLGYDNWAQVSLVSKMAGSVEEIEQLVEDLRRPSRPAAEVELGHLSRLAREMGAPEGEDLKPWDVSYWSEQLRRRRFDLDSEALRPWFPLEQVLGGLFGLCERLFDIRILAADGEAPTWHRDVRFFRVVDQGQNILATFYLDPYARPGQKRGGAWMDECLVRQRNEHGQVVPPVAYLICNQTPPVNGAPSLMTFMDVQTLFHEFGHGLQHMLTTIDRPQAAGLNLVEDDAIELASQFMENWCYDQPTIMAMARHWQTGAPLPESEFEKISASRTFMAGTAMLRQLGFARGDLELHARWQPGGGESPEAAWRRIAATMAVLPPIAEDANICNFEHLFAGGYAAGYYSYKWSEVLSADAFAAFEEVGLENEAAIHALGKQYRDTVLSLGGSRHAGEVFRAFRGREPSTEALLRHSGLVGEAGAGEKVRTLA